VLVMILGVAKNCAHDALKNWTTYKLYNF